jgi:hypothetical protein
MLVAVGAISVCDKALKNEEMTGPVAASPVCCAQFEEINGCEKVASSKLTTASVSDHKFPGTLNE